jgi:molecular chaperone HtpG
MEIPKRIAAKLDNAPSLHAIVLSSIESLAPLVVPNDLPLFPDFTDHGIGHLRRVLHLADFLITEEAFEAVTAADCAALVIAVLLHDAGMHLSPHGFLDLVSNGLTSTPTYGPEPHWREIWESFCLEARRWNERKLKEIFGGPTPVQAPDLVQPLIWTELQRRFVGEFLRRHHARLAHEIALAGVPGAGPERLRISSPSPEIADLWGFVARTHNMPIRKCMSIVESRLHAREYKDTHIIYLVALLRLADFLHIHAERAPADRLKLTPLASPLSKAEWEAHQAIENITYAASDPEALEVKCSPKDVHSFLKLRRWLNDIQSELDQSWAALGETFGRFHTEGLSPFGANGLRLRRIRSNLDDLEVFSRRVPFIPKEARLSADPNLLHLLIHPLYGNYPQIGVRELLQNALDAVLERRDYCKTQELKFKASDFHRLPGGADVLISIEHKKGKGLWFTIIDRGIGMSPDTVINYFLRAGVSFRESPAWKQHFESESGDARVLRSGRFGVGSLAAFLIAANIHVTTRYIEKDQYPGLSFSLRFDDRPVELRKDSAAKIGTKIEIELAAEDQLIPAPARHGLKNATLAIPLESRGSEGKLWSWINSEESWDWYSLQDPKVLRHDRNKVLGQMFSTPGARDELPKHWHRIKSTGFADVMWSYRRKRALYCNGIRVVGFKQDWDNLRCLDDHWANSYLKIEFPAVSVFDPNGNLPLNLQRSDLTTNRLPFESELIRSVIQRALAYFLVRGPLSYVDLMAAWPDGLSSKDQGFRGFVYTNAGFAPLDASLWGDLESDSVIILEENRPADAQFIKEALSSPGVSVVRCSYAGNDDDDMPNEDEADEIDDAIMCPDDGHYGASHLFDGCQLVGGSLREVPEWLNNRATFLWNDERFSSRTRIGFANARYLRFGRCRLDPLKMKFLRKWAKSSVQPAVLAHLSLDRTKPVGRQSILAKLWREFIGAKVIPYDINERRRKLSVAFEKLKGFLREWQTEK